MKENSVFFQCVFFMAVCGACGFLISLTGVPVGWMIGTLLMAAFLSIMSPKWLKMPQTGIPVHWLLIGQGILGIELGMKLNDSVFYIFKENWLTVMMMLLLSLFFALLSGLILWKYSRLDMLTSFFASAPGGLSAMPGMAEEAGANTGMVSIIQTMRIFIVVLSIPILLFMWIGTPVEHTVSPAVSTFEFKELSGTVILVLAAWLGSYLFKLLKFPAPWLIGTMIFVAMAKSFSFTAGYDLTAWWPPELIILSQIFIGASIGSRFHKKMFIGLKETLFVSFLSTTGLVLSMFLCAYLVSAATDLPFITSVLAFAPGGIAEMTTAAVVFHADSAFVAAVQVLRVVAVCMILPPFFRFLHVLECKKKKQSRASA
ncbi:AbrB family transcriptional regulator [Metabacillus hrfriensis]|uniref:AbrB family transcriptional regulator n=1 Tax=Metabacillus hrfriensis TaxID=3048891 RepID=A0ACD4RFH0_9BACI|nr:AbrB family transcriptional regulator [Metabacillus sp. CT-WN-B3]WHZ59193.1 AbrB family transcriptional regulator [Metabacillus sp. CT-WN-B3]